MEGKAAGELSTAHSDLPELRKRLSARMGARYAAPFLRRRLPYPVVEDYRKANPSLEEKPLWCECCGQALRMGQKKYCSRACYLSAMEETHRRQVCAWCGEEFSVYAGEERQYCCRNCASAAQTAPKNFHRGRRRIQNTEPESWTEHIKQAAREAELDRDSRRVRLVCGETSMYAGPDSLTAIIRYRLRFNPYDGSVYVFRDRSGTMLKYLHWDGQGFCQRNLSVAGCAGE